MSPSPRESELRPRRGGWRNRLSARPPALRCPADQHAGEEGSAYAHPGECGLALLRGPPERHEQEDGEDDRHEYYARPPKPDDLRQNPVAVGVVAREVFSLKLEETLVSRVHSLKADFHHGGNAVTACDPLPFQGGHLGPKLELADIFAAWHDPFRGGSGIRAQR